MWDDFRAWKDEDLREELDTAAPANPVGSVDLSAIQGGLNYGAITWLPCTTAATVFFSCWPSCSNSVSHGSCGFLSVGCCG